MWVGGSSYSNLDTVAQDIPKASGPAFAAAAAASAAAVGKG